MREPPTRRARYHDNTIVRQLPQDPSSEILVDHHSAAGPVITTVRGSLLVSAIERLKAYGHHERYLEKLPKALHDEMQFSLAMSRLPVELLVEHCRACDTLELSDAELLQLGSQTASSMAQAMLGALLRTAGTTPLTVLGQTARIYERLFEGGSCMVYRTGPKDVCIEQSGNPLAPSRYFRTTAQGFYKSLAEMFSKTAYVKAARARHSPALAFAIELSWV
ncbi:MAG: hypothetical protein JWN04_3121 [Myxococcaceae bacterium]|nr:hypothetical protein [Myxococcaceae bacterium]